MTWENDLLDISQWALQSLDLRYRYIFSKTAKDLSGTPGLSICLENAVVFAIYEAARGKSYTSCWAVEHEKPYPAGDGINPKRSDLAFKAPGKGKNWAYVEVKKYDKGEIAKDIEKLQSLNGIQRWILAYRIRPSDGNAFSIADLLKRNFDGSDGQKIEIYDSREFNTLTKEYEYGICDICLARIK